MVIEINGKEYELKFGMKFLSELNKATDKNQAGMDIRIGVENATLALVSGDMLILPDLIKAGTATESNKPTNTQIEKYLDEADLDELAENFLEELKTQSATRKKVQAFLKELETR